MTMARSRRPAAQAPGNRAGGPIRYCGAIRFTSGVASRTMSVESVVVQPPRTPFVEASRNFSRVMQPPLAMSRSPNDSTEYSFALIDHSF